MQRIRRNAFYYTDSSKQNSWCAPCYDKLKDADPILLDDGTEIRKKDLQRLKNDAVAEEAWVECDYCKTWIHQICGLFNGRKNRTAAPFICPKCVLKERTENPEVIPSRVSTHVAKDLPHCAMSKAIERGLERALQKAYDKKAKELNCPVAHVEKANDLYVRVVSSTEKKHAVRDEV